MERTPTDADALRESLDEPARFTTVYERHLGSVHRFLRRRVGDEAAEELAADVFVCAFRARGRYDPQHDTALPWLLGIASNVIGGHRRAQRRRLALLERLARSGPPAQDREAAPAVSAELVHALRRLPAKDRDALLLVAWGELTYEEAAHALDIPIGTVRSRIARARGRLTAHAGFERPTPLTPIAAQGAHHD